MHPDLDLSGLLQEAYRGDLRSAAEKERLLREVARGDRPPILTLGLTWMPILIVVLILLGAVS